MEEVRKGDGLRFIVGFLESLDPSYADDVASSTPSLLTDGYRVIESGDIQGIVALLDSPNGLL